MSLGFSSAVYCFYDIACIAVGERSPEYALPECLCGMENWLPWESAGAATTRASTPGLELDVPIDPILDTI